MHIKKLTICGFKSFGDKLTIESFGEGVNIFIGNGKKSNLLEAISFVLNVNNAYENFTLEDFQALIHKPKTGELTSAYVEIVIQTPVESQTLSNSSEVCIKRVIDPDKLKYFQDNKQVERIDIKHFLAMLGFAPTYPFYCYIKQSDIEAVINMSDLDRSTLVKKMAGLDDFLKSKEKSLRILTETKEEIGKISDYLEKIEAQLEIHETESTQSIYNHSIEKKQAIEKRTQLLEDEEVEQSIDSLQNEISSACALKEQHLAEIADLDKDLKNIRRNSRLINPEIFKLQNEKFPIQKRRNDLASQQDGLVLAICNLEEQFQSQTHVENYAEQELELVEVSIEKKMLELNDLKGQKVELESIFTELSLQEDQLRAQFDDIFAKSEQNQRLGFIFVSKNERDIWMNNELKETVKKLKMENGRLKKANFVIEKEQKIQNELREELKSYKSELVALGSPNDFEGHQSRAFQQKNDLEKERKIISDTVEMLKGTHATSRGTMKFYDKELRRIFDESIMDGLNTMENLMAKKSNSALTELSYGTAFENFICPDTECKVVELLGREFLFYQIVQSTEVATGWLKLINSGDLPGDVNFFALDQMNVNVEELSASMNSQIRKLISKLTFDEKYKSIIYWIFSKTEPCINIELAIDHARTLEKDFITFDGDLVLANSAIVMNHNVSEDSVMILLNERKKCQESVSQSETRLILMEERLQDVQNSYDNLLAEILEIETKMVKARNLITNIQTKQRKLTTSEHNHQIKSTAKETAEGQIRILEEHKQFLEREFQLPMLTNAEQNEINAIQLQFGDLNEEIRENQSQQTECNGKRSKINGFLQNNLLARKRELKQLMASQRELENVLESQKKNYKQFQESLRELDVKLSEIDNKIRDLTQQQIDLKNQSQDANQKKRVLRDKIRDIDVKMERLNQQEDELRKKIHGSTSDLNDTFSTIYGMTADELATELANTDNQLMLFEQNNYDRLQKLAGFKKEKEELDKRKNELLQHETKIQQLIIDLEAENGKSVKSAFDRLNEKFPEVFHEFFPVGCAKLVSRPCDRDASECGEDKFTAVDIFVSFLSDSFDDIIDFKLLTDDRKRIVAIALIFAVQRCQPAPFYLFDCILENMTEEFRGKILSMIGSQQYFLTLDTPDYFKSIKDAYRVYNVEEMSHVDTDETEQNNGSQDNTKDSITSKVSR